VVEVTLGDRRDGQALQATVGTDEVCDERGRRRAEDCGWAVELLEATALGEDGDPVAETDGLLDVVRDEQNRLAHLVLEAQELVLELSSHHRVDGAERLVHQQHRWVRGERPGDTDPLPLATGQLMRVPGAVQCRIQPHQFHQLAGPLMAARRRPAEEFGHNRDVFLHRAVREEPDVLDDVAHAPAQPYRIFPRHVHAVDVDPSTSGLDQPIDDLHGRGLAGSRRPYEHDELAAPDVE
jgi:hypothetical protein